MIYRPTVANIDISALRRNYTKIKEVANCPVMPVVKANAYGHGSVEVAQALREEGVEIFGVATIEEGVELRENSIDNPVLILGSIYPFENYSTVIKYNLTPIIASHYSAKALEDTSRNMNVRTAFHLKIDTGMGRIGVSPDTAVRLWNEFAESDYLYAEGIFTHLARSDSDIVYTRKQIRELQRVLDDVKVQPKYVHAANTAGLINFSPSCFNLVRPGLAIYGLYPDGISANDIELDPVLSWRSKIVYLKKVSKSTPVSYGGNWIAPRESRIATVCVGYADGYSRALSNRSKVLIREKKCPVVGRVCMDMIMVDVTDIEGVNIGDDVILIGTEGSQTVTAEDMAGWADTINYEITTGISYRVPRIFLNGQD
jgi:alanine racemase